MKNKILLIAQTKQEALSIIQKVLELDKQQPISSVAATTIETSIPWQLSTKYYTAQILFIISEATSASTWTKQTSEECDALVLVSPTLNYLKEITKSLEHFENHPSVILLLSHTTTTTANEITNLREWCMENQAEFIDLDGVTVGRETEGLDRVIEALKTNQWENSVQKPQSSQKPSPPATTMTTMSTTTTTTSDTTRQLEPSEGEIEEEEEGISLALGKLKLLRDKAQKLPDAQRRALALKVALAFAGDEEDGDGDVDGDDDDLLFGDEELNEEDTKLAREVFARINASLSRTEPSSSSTTSKKK